MARKRVGRRQFGAIRKLPSGRYQARYVGPDGVLRPADRTFATVTDADLWLAKKRIEIEDGRWLDPDAGRITVETWAYRWLASVEPQLKPKTRALYRGLIRSRIAPAFGDREVAAVRPIMVGEWVAAMGAEGLSASRIRQAYRLMSQVMRSAVANGLRRESPCVDVRLPRMPETEPHILTPLEAARLVRETQQPYDVLVALLAFAGLRIGEAFALRRSDVDLAAGLLLVDENLSDAGGVLTFDTPKSHQKRTLALSPSLVKRLAVHLDGLPAARDTLLFTTRSGTPLRYNQWRKACFDPAVTAAGLEDVTPHDLRASHASWVADRHGVMTAARRLGHSNGSVTTRHYARPVPGRDAEVAMAMDGWLGDERHGGPEVAREWHADGSGTEDGASEAP
ncbi:tyrosine-type recombinase/integrase [Streptacidiphilus sp. ASG 303]|uniref:tyrosine-type recombinase/integrase n=1 Tax=Streptacidiphilus sp. ASG 303 TaxID=2896847 RepID=UPI001E3D426A|nr:tyrosine-type recombinase/integrase [Streptacidiphilus sp. ASG 303]MCD0482339.1 tyrosine-type recombinase/integrase [Streptacidiphilus sp. ASG 303]